MLIHIVKKSHLDDGLWREYTLLNRGTYSISCVDTYSINFVHLLSYL